MLINMEIQFLVHNLHLNERRPLRNKYFIESTKFMNDVIYLLRCLSMCNVFVLNVFINMYAILR